MSLKKTVERRIILCYTVIYLYSQQYLGGKEAYKLDEIKNVVAENLKALRTTAGLTQGELAEQLNYSDKAVSKWERGESIPDVQVLKQLADMY